VLFYGFRQPVMFFPRLGNKPVSMHCAYGGALFFWHLTGQKTSSVIHPELKTFFFLL